MHRSKFPFKTAIAAAFALATSIFLVGCETLSTATVAEGQISNGTVGFYGYSAEVPSGYTYVPSINLADANLSELETAAAYLKTKFINRYFESATVRDTLVFINEAEATVLVIFVRELKRDLPLGMLGPAEKREMSDYVRDATPTEYKGNWGERYYGDRYSLLFGGRVNADTYSDSIAVGTLWGRLREVFTVVASSRDQDPSFVQGEVEDFFATLRIPE